MAADELTKALLVEEVATPKAIADALFASVSGGVPFLQALVEAGAASPELLQRYLARTEAPFLRNVVAAPELVDQLPAGLCARLLALPVRQDAATGTVDVVVADPADPHPAIEIAFHLGAPVRMIRAPLAAIEEAVRRLRMRRDDRPADQLMSRFREAAEAHASGSLPPPAPELLGTMPSSQDVPPRHGGLVLDTESAPPPAAPLAETPVHAPRIRTPPWGTPVHSVRPAPPTEPPTSGYGSEIPIPLTRRAWGIVSGGTQRPPAFVDPSSTGLGEGYTFDNTGLRDVVEKGTARSPTAAPPSFRPIPPPSISVRGSIPGPPGLPGGGTLGPAISTTATAPGITDVGGVLAALRNVDRRDEILDLVLTGARMVAVKVALFVVKKGGYHGWSGSLEFGDRDALQQVLIPLDANSIFDDAVREDFYLGPIRADEVHAPLLRVMKNPSRDVAAVPIRVSGKTAVIIVADELGDTMLGTRRLEELAKAAGEAFSRLVRTRR